MDEGIAVDQPVGACELGVVDGAQRKWRTRTMGVPALGLRRVIKHEHCALHGRHVSISLPLSCWPPPFVQCMGRVTTSGFLADMQQRSKVYVHSLPQV